MDRATLDRAYAESEFIWMDSHGHVELPLSSNQIEGVGCSGDNEPAVNACLEHEDSEVLRHLLDTKRGELVMALREHGAWSDTELQDHEANKQRIIWIAGSDIADDPDTYRQCEA